MKTKILILLFQLFTAFGSCQFFYDGSGKQIARFDGNYIYGAAGKQIGRVDGDYIYDGAGK